MSERYEVLFPGGKRVDVRVGDFVIQTDQSLKRGGEASAPEPFDLFLSSMAACAGIFALNFCTSRDLPTAGLGLSMDAVAENSEAPWEMAVDDVVLLEAVATAARLGLDRPTVHQRLDGVLDANGYQTEPVHSSSTTQPNGTSR